MTVDLEESVFDKTVKKLSAFHGTISFIITFIKVRHWSLSTVTLLHFLASFFFKVHFKLIFHLCWGLRSSPSLPGFADQNVVYVSYVPCVYFSVKIIILAVIAAINKLRAQIIVITYFSKISLSCSLLGHNIFLNFLIFYTLNLYSRHRTRDQGLHPSKTTDKYTIFYFNHSVYLTLYKVHKNALSVCLWHKNNISA